MAAMKAVVAWAHDTVSFERWTSPQFASAAGLGRTGLASFMLGLLVGSHVILLVLNTLLWRSWILWQWTIYVAAVCLYHFLEFLTTALFKPLTVSYDSFVINHSHAYTAAVMASVTEFWMEHLVFGARKQVTWAFSLGIVFIVGGQFFRAAAMSTAAENFSHVIMERRNRDHRLVTHGVYRWRLVLPCRVPLTQSLANMCSPAYWTPDLMLLCMACRLRSYLRHPSYFGWFYWCIGTQLVLCNPICTAGYAYTAWNFFRSRIPYEEATLRSFYPDEYPAYVSRTFVGIPFIPVSMVSDRTVAGGGKEEEEEEERGKGNRGNRNGTESRPRSLQGNTDAGQGNERKLD